MPWQERSLVDVRLRFVQDVHRPGWSVVEVCRRYQVSRKTGYKWLERYEQAGPAGLTDRLHRVYLVRTRHPGAVSFKRVLGRTPHITPLAAATRGSHWQRVRQ